MAEAIKLFLKETGLEARHNVQRIYAAWDEASMASVHTISKYYRDGMLYVTLRSSMARTHIQMQKRDILRQMNVILSKDPLFVRKDSETEYVKEIVLK